MFLSRFLVTSKTEPSVSDSLDLPEKLTKLCFCNVVLALVEGGLNSLLQVASHACLAQGALAVYGVVLVCSLSCQVCVIWARTVCHAIIVFIVWFGVACSTQSISCCVCPSHCVLSFLVVWSLRCTRARLQPEHYLIGILLAQRRRYFPMCIHVFSNTDPTRSDHKK